MWQESPMERQLKSKLGEEWEQDRADEIFADYVTARQKLTKDVLPEIKGVEPSLTDHGPVHIRNVLDNVDFLIPSGSHNFSGTELYCLCLGVLFHDVGNLEGRDKHNLRVAQFYDHVRGGTQEWNHEKYLITRAAQAHTGKCRAGTNDTLKDVPEREHLFGKPVRLRVIAAIIRFADELAEGPQRTSEFMRRHERYEPSSQLFHDYASITQVCIDRNNNRIALTYSIDLPADKPAEEVLAHTRGLLELTYRRILKLDQERRYARFYARELLVRFEVLSIQFNFQIDGEFVELDLQPLIISDKVVPGDAWKELHEWDGSYELENVILQLRECLGRQRARSHDGNPSATTAVPDPGARVSFGRVLRRLFRQKEGG